MPIAEILTGTGLSFTAITIPFWASLPFSRGNVHISSANPLNASMPAINPNFYMNPFDSVVQIAAGRFARRLLVTAPLAGSVGAAISPNVEEVPEDARDEVWLAWLKGSYAPNWHPLGTAAMMSEDLGGVVDTELKVYGTANLRIVDASVIPRLVSGHPTSTIYAVAERAAELILGTG